MTLAFFDIDLGTGEGARLLQAVCRTNPHLAGAAALLRQTFLIRSPWAPGLRFVGAQAEYRDAAFSVGGSGLSLEHALTSCLGEAAERLSQVEHPGDILPSSEFAALDRSAATRRLCASIAPDLPLDQADWVVGASLKGPCAVPADWCLRRPKDGPLRCAGTALSTGCAAGSSIQDATARALLELIERDASAAWWSGAREPAAFPIRGEALELLIGLRQDQQARRTWLLDISADLGVPVVAALSCSHDDRELTIGVGARCLREQAVEAAILELCQMEVGLQLARLKQRERIGLMADDERHLARAGLEIAADSRLRPLTSSTRDESPAAADGLAYLLSVFGNASDRCDDR